MRSNKTKKAITLLLILIGHTCLLPGQVKGQLVDGTTADAYPHSLLTGIKPETAAHSFNFIVVSGANVTVHGKEYLLRQLFASLTEWVTNDVTLIESKGHIALKNVSNIPMEIDFLNREVNIRTRVSLMPDSITTIPVYVDPETAPDFESASIKLTIFNFITEDGTPFLLFKKIRFKRGSVK